MYVFALIFDLNKCYSKFLKINNVTATYRFNVTILISVTICHYIKSRR